MNSPVRFKDRYGHPTSLGNPVGFPKFHPYWDPRSYNNGPGKHLCYPTSNACRTFKIETPLTPPPAVIVSCPGTHKPILGVSASDNADSASKSPLFLSNISKLFPKI